MEGFRVNFLWILPGTWSKVQERVWAEVERGVVEVRGGRRLLVPRFLLLPTVILLGLFAVLGSQRNL